MESAKATALRPVVHVDAAGPSGLPCGSQDEKLQNKHLEADLGAAGARRRRLRDAKEGSGAEDEDSEAEQFAAAYNSHAADFGNGQIFRMALSTMVWVPVVLLVIVLSVGGPSVLPSAGSPSLGNWKTQAAYAVFTLACLGSTCALGVMSRRAVAGN